MTLFEDICFNILLEGKTPEEILAALKYKFKDVPEEVILKLFEMDTTKKKSYTQWVLSHWAEESAEIEQLIVSGKMKEVFDFIKETHDIQIQGYKSVKELVEDLKYKMSSGLDLLEKNGTGPENDFTILYNSPEWVVVTPNTYEASHKLGVGTSWCTAGWRYDNGKYYYDRYLNGYGGKYYINFDKRSGEKDCAGVERPYKRYQFHFESNQFMNILDRSVNIATIDMPEDVIEFYEKVEPVKMEKFINSAKHEKRKQAYLAIRREYAIQISETASILPRYDDDLNTENLPNIREFGLYDMDYDEVDPISYGYFNKNILFYGEINHHLVLIVNNNINDATDYDRNLRAYIKGEYPCKPAIYVSKDGGRCFTRWYGFNGCDNVFYSVLEKNLFVISADRVCDLLTNVDNPFEHEVAPQKAFLNCEIDGKQYFEVVWEDGFHSLYCSNTNISDSSSRNYKCRERFYPIISLDLPPEGEEKFEVTMNSVKGKLIPNYDISSNNNNFKIIEQLYDNFYVVMNPKDNYYMVYDVTEQRECFFTDATGKQIKDFDWISKIEDRPFFIGSLRESFYRFLFSLPLRKIVYRLYDYGIDDIEGEVYDYSGHKAIILHDNGEYEIKYEDENEEGEEMTSKTISENFNRFLKRINDVEF